MRYDPRPFRETPDYRETHRDIVRDTRVSPGILHGGTPGVLIKFGRTFAVISTADAITFATLIADTVDKVKKGTVANQ